MSTGAVQPAKPEDAAAATPSVSTPAVAAASEGAATSSMMFGSFIADDKQQPALVSPTPVALAAAGLEEVRQGFWQIALSAKTSAFGPETHGSCRRAKMRMFLLGHGAQVSAASEFLLHI